MTMTTSGLIYCAIRLGSNITTPQYIALGAGSATADSNRYDMLGSEHDRNIYTSLSFATAKKMELVANWNVSELASGTKIYEIGVFHLNSGGVAWQVTGFAPFTFDGYTELQMTNTWEVS